VLPEWEMPTANGWAVFPSRKLMPAKTRAFLAMMEETCTAHGHGPEQIAAAFRAKAALEESAPDVS